MASRALNHRPGVRSQVWAACAGRCHHCGKELDPFLDFHLDHLIPLARGGVDAIDNLVGSCKTCNTKRGGRGDEPKKVKAAKFKSITVVKIEVEREPIKSTKVADSRALRLKRMRMGYSLRDLSELSGVTQDNIWKIETGVTRRPHGKTLRKLAEALGLEVRELLKESES